MFISSLDTRTKRRGVVLVLILGMLGLLALIGVTFATFSNQAQINARNFSQSASFPDPNEMMDFALAQLINDTANPQSVIRGHSLKRDMYGSDAGYNGALLNGAPDGTPMVVTTVTAGTGAYAGMLILTTNIPIPSNAPMFYPYDFTRWVLTFPATASSGTYYVARTHEILVDDSTGSLTGTASGYREFAVAMPSYSGATPPPASPPIDPSITGYASPEAAGVTNSTLMSVPTNTPFLLDGRFLKAFNGPGMAGMNAFSPINTANMSGGDTTWLAAGTLAPHPLSEYANFRYNGNVMLNVMNASNASYTANFNPGYGDPNALPVAMDEDYDACDLENWFLAIQSADGKVVIPSFHRPGIVTQFDWSRTTNAATNQAQQLLATRAMSRVLRPRQVDGHSSISFPDLLPDPKTKQITYDIDNDGDGMTDSVWLDLGYPPKRSPEGQLFKPLFAFMVVGLNGRLPLNTAGNLQDRSDTTLNPVFDHTEHLGTSPSEIDLRYALQNAYDSNFTPNGNVPIGLQGNYQQFDNAGFTSPYDFPVGVAQTQFRNLLTGTRQVNSSNYDLNKVVVNGISQTFPNNYADVSDNDPLNPWTSGQANYVRRLTPPVAGRWGESDYVPGLPSNPLVSPVNAAGANVPYFNNAIRAGYSVNGGAGNWDARDDNFNSYDFYPAWNPSASTFPENLDFYDAAGALTLPVERIRRFVTPIDVDGNGEVITFGGYNPNPTLSSSIHANGADVWGRVNFFSYFRPPGMPVVTASAFGTPFTPTTPYNTTPAPISAGYQAVWYDTNSSLTANPPTYPRWDVRTNNPYHAYVASLSPDFKISQATDPNATSLNSALALGGMPSDIDAASMAVGPPPVVTPLAPGTVGTLITTTVPGSTPPTQIVPPTYTNAVNSNAWDGGAVAATNWGSPGLNEADEMNLFQPNRLDSAFGAGDLEWLYRYQDVDGVSLTSRLQDLAPISFLNPKDGFRRRRLFCLDTWEPTNFVWANDNPSGVFAGNSRFSAITNASFSNINYSLNANGVAVNAAGQANRNTLLAPDPASDFSVLSNSTGLTSPSTGNTSTTYVQTPPIAQRDRRINLNFPLPVSNSEIEPVRQKWVRETYQLLKAVLPPKSVDTPEELAQLSQYVVNMLDFRDPDATMTRFVNTDVIVVEPTSLTQQAVLGFSHTPPTLTPPIPTLPAVAYDYTYNILSTGGSTATGHEPAIHYLVQYGMEYQPVAINEVLAYQFQSRLTTTPAITTPTASPNNNTDARMQVELVNMLTKDAITGNYPDSSDLDLAAWDLVVLPDDGYGRPDPYTGQVPVVQPGLYLPPTPASPPYTGAPPVPAGQPFVSISVGGGSLALLSGQPAPTPPASTGTATPSLTQYYYYVLGDEPLAQAGGTTSTDSTTAGAKQPNPSYAYYQAATAPTTPLTPPVPPGYVDLTGMLYQRSSKAATSPTPPSATSTALPLNPGYYYWVYLRRPANPFDPTSDKVVVDSFRFVFQQSRGLGYDSSGTPTVSDSAKPGTPITTGPPEYIFSLERLQPYRGGHAIPPLQTGAVGATTPPNVYTTQTFIPAYGYTEQTAACQQSSGTVATTTPPVSPSNPARPTGAALPAAGATGTVEVAPVTAGLIPPMSALLQIASTTGNGTSGASADNPNGGTGGPGAPPTTYIYWTQGMYGTVKSTGTIYHTIGSQNLPSDNARDYFMFNDRDYMNVVELLMVPASAPGLFTKQFAEMPPPVSQYYQGVQALAYQLPSTLPTTLPAPGPLTAYASGAPATSGGPGTGTGLASNTPAAFGGWGSGTGGAGNTTPSTPYASPWPQDTTLGTPWNFPPHFAANGPPHPFPYLNDEFFYTGYSEPAGATWVNGQPPNTAASPAYYRSATADANGVYHDIGGPAGAGFHKMLDFFEAPSPAFGAIGEVATGTNYDWARQDLKPGLLNINLIIDEEVFLGLMGASHYGVNNHGMNGTMNQGQIGMPGSTSYKSAVTPGVLSQAADPVAGTPSLFYHMNNVGIWDPNGFVDPIDGTNYPFTLAYVTVAGVGGPNGGTNITYNAAMKACFADFLSLKAGGTGILFNYLNERPFHSLSYPDINFTLLRPATLPPAVAPSLPMTLATPTAGSNWTTTMTADPAFKNPYLFTITSPVQPPPIPPRRLFQIADAYGSPDGSTVSGYGTANATAPSNASVVGDPNVNVLQQVTTQYALAILNPGSSVVSAYPDLTGAPLSYTPPIATPFVPSPAASPAATTTGYNLKDYLGGQFTAYAAPTGTATNGTYTYPNPSQTNPQADQTDHPYFRTEWLQKVANLTTVRTHQYAVWITVGFFEVTTPGDPTLAATNPFLAYDQLGNELGYLDGKNTRYRGFFLVDRTRATGFNPFQPDDFRGCVVYRQLIE